MEHIPPPVSFFLEQLERFFSGLSGQASMENLSCGRQEGFHLEVTAWLLLNLSHLNRTEQVDCRVHVIRHPIALLLESKGIRGSLMLDVKGQKTFARVRNRPAYPNRPNPLDDEAKAAGLLDTSFPKGFDCPILCFCTSQALVQHT